MSNLIQIKRSLTTAVPASLANGELAFTSNGDVLYIGANGGIVPIAGKRTPGVLAANQAIVANGSGYVDFIKTANAWIDTLYANGSIGAAGQVLVSNGTTVYWGTGTSGSNTQVQFNDSGVANASAGFTFDKTSNTLSIANTIQVQNLSVNTISTGNNLIIGNVTINTNAVFVGNTTANSLQTNARMSVSNSTSTANLVATGLVVGNTEVSGSTVRTGNSTANVSISGTGIVSSGGTGVNPSSNSTGSILGTASARWVVSANSINASGLITANGGITVNGTANVSTNILVGANVIVNTSAYFVGNSTSNATLSNTILTIANSSSTANINSRGLVVGTTTVNNSTVAVEDLLVSGNTRLGTNTADTVSINGLVNTDIMPIANNTYQIGNNSMFWKEINVANVHAVDGYFTGDVDILGNLVVTGNVITTNVQSVVISDPLIYLAGNNYAADLVDIGFVGNYHQSGTNKHTGMFRHAATDQYYVFKELTQELSGVNTINIADPTFTLADVNAYLISGGLTSNATAVRISANSTVTVNVIANTLSLSVALPGTSGGTGQNTYASGDILVGNTGNALSKLSLGSSGHVLQSNGTALIYDTLDGGVF